MITAQLDAITPFNLDQGTGKLQINWQDGQQQEFPTVAEFISWLQDNTPSLDTLRAILLIQCLIDDPLMDSIEIWQNRKVEVNAEAATGAGILKVTPA